MARADSPAAVRGPLRIVEIAGVLVATPVVPLLDDDATLDAARAALLDRLERPGLPRRLVIDLGPLGVLPGRAVGLLVAHHLRLQHAGGSMRLAGASGPVASALAVLDLPKLIPTYPTVDEAVLDRWPD